MPGNLPPASEHPSRRPTRLRRRAFGKVAQRLLVTDAKHILLGQLAWALLRRTGVEEDYKALTATYAALPAVLDQTHQEAVPFCEEPVL